MDENDTLAISFQGDTIFISGTDSIFIHKLYQHWRKPGNIVYTNDTIGIGLSNPSYPVEVDGELYADSLRASNYEGLWKGLDTSDIGEGTISDYTDADAIDAINNDADHGSTAQHDYFVTGDETDPVFTAHLANDIDASDTTWWGSHYTDSDIDGSESAFAGWDKDASNDFDSADVDTESELQTFLLDVTNIYTENDTSSTVATKYDIDSLTNSTYTHINNASNPHSVTLQQATDQGNSTDVLIEHYNSVNSTSIRLNSSDTYTPSVFIHGYYDNYNDVGIKTNSGDPQFIFDTDGNLNVRSGTLLEQGSRVYSPNNVPNLQTITDAGNSTDNNIVLTGTYNVPTSGSGLELKYNIASNYGVIYPYDRDGNNYKRLDIRGTPINLGQGNVNITDGVLQVDGAGDSYISGNVGIGTTSPAEKLDVDGNIQGDTAKLDVINSVKMNGNIELKKVATVNSDTTGLNVSGINFIDFHTADSNITVYSFEGGVNGQVIHGVHSGSDSYYVSFDAGNGPQPFRLPSDPYGGQAYVNYTFIYYDGYWYIN
jgi:hypothetical protein